MFWWKHLERLSFEDICLWAQRRYCLDEGDLVGALFGMDPAGRKPAWNYHGVQPRGRSISLTADIASSPSDTASRHLLAVPSLSASIIPSAEARMARTLQSLRNDVMLQREPKDLSQKLVERRHGQQDRDLSTAKQTCISAMSVAVSPINRQVNEKQCSGVEEDWGVEEPGS